MEAPRPRSPNWNPTNRARALRLSKPKREGAISPELLRPIVLSHAVAVGSTQKLSREACAALLAREVNVSEAFTLVDAEGAFFRASLKAMSPDGGEALVYERMHGSTESPACITLVCAVLGRQRMITVVQKATELGCMRITPVLSDHSVKREDLEREKPWAWRGQALKGARQCRRASVPLVDEVMSLDRVLASPTWKAATARFVLDDVKGEKYAFPAQDESTGSPKDYVLAVGPEGGWSDRERTLLEKAGAIALALGVRVLRAETAVFAGLSVLQHRLGDLR